MNHAFARLVKEELSGENAKSYVGQIARFHRIQASPMFHEAAEYVRDTLLKDGLVDAKIEQFSSDGEKKYWTYISPMGWKVKSAELRLLEPEQRLLARYADTPTCLHTHSKSTPPDGVIAELVDVGTGLKPEEYRGKDVKGKLVLATGKAARVHEQAVYKRGAAGVITDTLSYEWPSVRESLDIPDAHSYQSIWPTKKDSERVTFGFSLTKRQGDHLRALLRKKKVVRLQAIVDASLFPNSLDVVTATIQGATRPDEEVFLIAHLCHPQPSANDNASGSGLLLEIARTVKALIDSGKIPQPKRTMRFMWVPENYGTVAYLSTNEDLVKCFIAGINLDMVGQNQEECRSTLTLDRTPDSLPSYLNDLVLSLLERSTTEFDMMTSFGSASTFRFAVNKHTGGSDHHQFVDSTVGIPCVMLLQWPDLFYHSSMDTIDKVSATCLKRIGWIATVAALTLANADERDAVLLVNQTCSRGISRLEEAVREALQAIPENAANTGSVENLHGLAQALRKTASQYRDRVNHIIWREKEAVHSVGRLATGRDLNRAIKRLSRELDVHGGMALKRIEETLSFAAKATGLHVPLELEETEDDREAKSIVPTRLFKGTLSFETFRGLLGEEEYRWYDEMEEKDPDFRKRMAETLNFMDGKRSLLDITKAVSAEYPNTDMRQMLKFVEDLQKTNLVVTRRQV